MYYFCYSSALDSAATQEWAESHGYPDFSLSNGTPARARDFAIEFSWPSRYWGGRVANLVSEAKALAHGIVFEIPDTKLLAVRHKEGVVTGIAVEQRIRVELKDGKTIEALAYSVSPERRSLEGPVSESFIKTLCAAYDKWGLEVPSYR